MTMAEIIIARREKAGLTQQELADQMKVPKQRIVGYEKGIHEPSFLTYKILIKVCNQYKNIL